MPRSTTSSEPPTFDLRGALPRTDGTERELAVVHSMLRSVLESVPDPVVVTDANGRVVELNGRARPLLWPGEQISEGRRRAVELNHVLFSAALAHLGAQGSRELTLVDAADGSDLLFELLGMRGGAEPHTFTVAVLRDVTELRRATREIEENYRRLRLVEAQVRADRDRLDLVIDNVADPILVTDPAGDIIHMNAPAERLFMAAPDASEDAQQQRAFRVNASRFSSFVANMFIGGAKARHRGDFELISPDNGAVVPVEAVAGRVLSGQGDVTHVVTILHDRTDLLEKTRLYEQLKHASEELEAKVREATAELVLRNEQLLRQHIALEQASALKSQFLANLSHELRTPLTAILGYTSMILSGVGDTTPSDAQRRYLDRIESNSRHLLSLINDILDVTRIEAGRMPLRLRDFSLPALVAELLEEVEPLVRRANLTVSADVPAGIPKLRTDRQKLKQIILNLLLNAVKFTPEGSVTVRAAYSRRRDTTTLSVTDTGIGVAEDQQAFVFDTFRQVDSSPTRQRGGVGLGLAIARRLTDVLGGTLTLESKLGEGSTFTVVIPRRCPTKRGSRR